MINLAQSHSHSLSPYNISDISLYVLYALYFHIRWRRKFNFTFNPNEYLV